MCFIFFQYSDWILSPPITPNVQNVVGCDVYESTLSSNNILKSKLLASSLKTTTRGSKVIRIEIYDASQFQNVEKSVCKCNAEMCAQHVVENIYSDNIYAKVRDILKSLDNSLYVTL